VKELELVLIIFRINLFVCFIFSVLVCEMEFQYYETDQISIDTYKTIIYKANFKKGCVNNCFGYKLVIDNFNKKTINNNRICQYV
jgi:hypothetical protein